MNRRDILKGAFGAVGLGALGGCAAPKKEIPYGSPSLMPAELRAIDNVRGPLKITKLEMRLVKPRWLFLQIHTDAGITGLG